MKNNELRLGNLVFRKYWNPQPENERFCLEPCIVIFISGNNVNVSPINKKVKLKFKIDSGDISAIELSEEWLFKFVFEVASIADMDYLYYTDKEHLYYLMLDLRRKEDGFDLLNNSVKELETITCVGIKYVHQLQNLYFALTGVELSLSNT